MTTNLREIFRAIRISEHRRSREVRQVKAIKDEARRELSSEFSTNVVLSAAVPSRFREMRGETMNKEVHDFIKCDRLDCAANPIEHCQFVWCGAPKDHPSHTCFQPKEELVGEQK